jgi:hypothetical protein
VDYELTGTMKRIRRSCRLTIADELGELAPVEPGEFLFPGERIRLDRGILFPSGPVWWPMFEGIVSSFDAEMRGIVSLAAEDPVSNMQADPFGEPLVIPDGMPASEALRVLWEPVLGSAAFGELDDGGRVTALRTFLGDEQRLDAVLSLMFDLGLEVSVTRTGLVELRPRPDPTSAAAVAVVREFRSLPGEAAWLTLARSGSDQPVNEVVVNLIRPDLPTLTAVQSVTDEASPVHWRRIGRRTRHHQTSQVGDQAALNALAEQYLVEYTLNVDTIRGDIARDHRLDPRDIVLVQEPRSRTDDRYRLNRVSHPVTRGARTTLEASRVLPIFLLEQAA